MILGELIAVAREVKGWSQRDLEKASGVSNALISQIETGKVRDPGFSTVIRLVDALGITLDRAAKSQREMLNMLRKTGVWKPEHPEKYETRALYAAPVTPAALSASREREALLTALVQQAAAIFKHCTVTEGVCCCGDSMDGHPDAMSAGHGPVDQGEYQLSLWLKEARAALNNEADHAG